VSVSGHGRALGRAGLAAFVTAAAAMALVPSVASAAGFVVAGSRSPTGVPLLRTFADNTPAVPDGKYETLVDEMVPFKTAISDGVRVATGDFDGDGNDEVVAATDKSTTVKIFELGPNGELGTRIGSVAGFPHGTYVAAGDVNGDERDDLITSAGGNDGEVVKIRTDLNKDGVPGDVTDSFAAYPAARTGGVRVAAANVSNSGGDEVITAPGPDKLPVKIWKDADADGAVSDNPLEDQLMPFGASFAGGMFVAAGQIQSAGNNGAEVIVTRADSTGKMVIRTDSDSDGKVSDNPPFDHVAAPYPGLTKGARVAAGDTDHSGSLVEVITAPGEKTGANPLKIYDDDVDAGFLISDNPLSDSFTSFPGNQGAYVAFGRVTHAVYPYTGFPQNIPDAGTTVSTIQVPASAGLIQDLEVSLNISHSFDGDLDVTLSHVPTSKSLLLFNDVGGTNEGFQITLNDEAGTDIGSASNPKLDGSISGTFNPIGAGLLSTFDGIDASGQWQLQIVDDTAADTGTLQGWALHVTY